MVTTPPPTSVTAGVPFSLVVTAEDGSGNVDSTYTGPVTLALFGGTSGAMLGGTLTVNAVNGVAAFPGLTIDTAGTGYTLTASSGTLTSAKSSINVAAATAAPSVTGLSLTSGPAAGGTAVTIIGTNFTGATAVQFGAVNATSYTVDSTGTVITAVSPAGTAGTFVDITVTTPGGTSPHVGADTFQFVSPAATGAPSVTGLSLTSGPAAGGTAVTIIGTNFTGATAVQFGAVNATSYTVDSTGTVITAVSPAGTAGTFVDITVTTPGGTSPHVGADTFQFVSPAATGAPSVTGLSLTSGPAAGGTAVTIFGTNFTGATAVQFGAVNATSYTVDSPGVITAVSPAGTAGTFVDITVTTPGGTSPHVGADTFQFV